MAHHSLLPALAGIFALTSAPLIAGEPVTVSLDWSPNTNHVGLYVAQALGFYEQAGLDVEIVPHSARGPADDFQMRSVLSLFTLRAAGEDVTGVLAVIQRETGRLVIAGERSDIAGPGDLEGKIYGGFGTAWERALIDTMIAHDGGAPDYETVILSGSVYDALDAGEVDFTLDIYTWEGVLKEIEGRPYTGFAYADYGVPDQHTTLMLARTADLEADRERARAFVSATREGYAYALANPDEAATILVDAAPELADEAALVRASLAAIIEGGYFATPAGEVGMFSDEKMEALGRFLFEAGALLDADGAVLTEQPDVSAHYTNAYLD